ncbi:homeobox-DDT domain protein RLT1 isoform X2 [Selaginella moellendorffii]|uniref:homeobox-DDT domain protein RLT1 isoform X2 n=1 Tax=Selaginella moellendorffii TaxID=88036 RepID=UPI000D1C9F03|nr:homeobox-DDT domain protein RLT1 isoform X2 [Selaginella moellendorffii]|eukprot:XP_024517144.1 homeobox-DDT domain protein RLT1 isoform X2 [Selaginella moellendorffii]
MEGDDKPRKGEDKDKGLNTKRKMKTPSQLEILERVYAEDKYPSEVVRAELSTKLSLTDRQLQMWFCHRRLKDRKGDEGGAPPGAPAATSSKKQKRKKDKEAATGAGGAALLLLPPPPPLPPNPSPASMLGAAVDLPDAKVAAVAAPAGGEEVAKATTMTTKKEGGGKKRSAAAMAAEELKREREVITLVEQQLGEPIREDGPVLGREFDPLPPGPFDTPIDSSTFSLNAAELKAPGAPELGSSRRTSPLTSSRTIPREHQFIPEHPTGAQFQPCKLERDGKGKAQQSSSSLTDARVPNLSLNFLPHGDADAGVEEQLLKPSHVVIPEMPEPPQPGSSKKRKSDDAKLARELEAQEKKLKREAEKQEAARRKREEQERKEIEKINRERQRELEKINRERQREEERHQREQKKEQDRLERLAQKEQQRLEKLRLKEEVRRQKEAAKLQAAYERATAKKLAKLSTGLMDDEQLELMQMGAFVQGLVSGDMEGGSAFDPSKVELKKYPPASVRMKKVLGVSPWDSVQNVSNLLMVWGFLTTFSDAIGLWPFTVDELVQGLHDFDSRLLNETYIALLRTLIRDVEDAAQAAASGTAGSQHAIAVAAGGHPQIVEAAYTWGFDIQEWGQHMSPLTWPEILRQFALAAGYGPRWKKKTQSPDAKPDCIEIHDGHNANAIATLRSGAAAVNAVALMRGKHGTRLKVRKGQTPKLTPGTVKYAAFHVLSIQGSKGLTILELTDRIQKSGLRDLSSSKTPEASISAALSRDTYLFERVAPSTYCVRSPFRRDPDDAEDVLQAALERTYLYQTRQLDPEKADEDVEDAEEESEGEEHEVEEAEHESEHMDAEVERAEQHQQHEDAREHDESGHASESYETPRRGKVILRLKTGKPQDSAGEATATAAAGTAESFETETPAAVAAVAALADSKDDAVRHLRPPPDALRKVDNDDEMEIDESQVGEPWVQGLMEGEFADLSIEERLNALVALVDVLNEGNTIRSVLEERYESASALKRQLWEEVQVDKRRIKEEASKSAAKSEVPDDERPAGSAAECDNGASTSAAAHADKSRVQIKAEIRLRAEKLYVIRSMPLGLDRRHNRYWQFAASNGGEDPGRARIYFECNEDGHWEVIDTEEALDALMACLDTRGAREASLYNILTHIGGPVRKAMKSLAQSRAYVESSKGKAEGSPSSGVFGPSDASPEVPSAIPVELGRSTLEIQHAMDRFKDLDRWLWNRCLARGGKNLKALSLGNKRDVEMLATCELCHGLYWPDENHCPYCHAMVESSKFSSHVRECESKLEAKQGIGYQLLPSRLQLLKQLLLSVEVAVPAEAFKDSWTSDSRRIWCSNVKAASSSSELLEALTELESCVDENWISSSFETAEKALSTTALGSNSRRKNLPWIPQTTAAVALRLSAFDAAIAFSTEQRQQLEETYQNSDHGFHRGTADEAAPNANEFAASPQGTSSPDSGSPLEVQNGHVRMRSPQHHRSSYLEEQHEEEDNQQQEVEKQQQMEQQQPGRGRLLFRFPGRNVEHRQQAQAGASGGGGEMDESSDEDDEEGQGWERQGSDEHSYEDDQQHHHQQHHHHQQQEEEEEDEEEGQQAPQHFYDRQEQEEINSMIMGEEESYDEEEEEEGEELHRQEQQQRQQHHGQHHGDYEEEEEVEEEEVELEEELSEESS